MSSIIRVSILNKIIGAGPLDQNFPNAQDFTVIIRSILKIAFLPKKYTSEPHDTEAIAISLVKQYDPCPWPSNVWLRVELVQHFVSDKAINWDTGILKGLSHL